MCVYVYIYVYIYIYIHIHRERDSDEEGSFNSPKCLKVISEYKKAGWRPSWRRGAASQGSILFSCLRYSWLHVLFGFS